MNEMKAVFFLLSVWVWVGLSCRALESSTHADPCSVCVADRLSCDAAHSLVFLLKQQKVN